LARNYSDNEVEAIFRRALERQVEEEDGYGHEELIAAAREVGLDDEAIDRTLREIDDERGVQAIRERLDKKARRAWLNHFVTYLIIAGGFLGMHALGFTGAWAIWMAFGWGMALALQTFSTFRGPTEEDVEKEQKKLNRKARRVAQARARRDEKKRKKQAEAERKARRKRGSEAGDELERVIEEGVTLLLGAAANKLREATRQMEAPAAQTEFERYVQEKKTGKPRGSKKKKKGREPVVTPPPRASAHKARVELDPGHEPADEVEVARRRGRDSRSSK